MLCPGDIVRVQGERAAEVQHVEHSGGANASVGVTYIECRSGVQGFMSRPSQAPVTLLRSSALRAA
jgi:hypothetical protein